MTAYTTRQYNPVSDLETAADDGLSVRAINDLADGINNYSKWAGRHALINQLCMPHWSSPDAGDTDEKVIALFAPRVVPDGFNRIVWSCGHYRDNGADDIIWRMYCNQWLYYGDEVMDTDKLSQDYSVSSFTTSSGTHAISVQTDLDVVRGANGFAWLVLTAENQDGSTDGYITHIGAWTLSS